MTRTALLLGLAACGSFEDEDIVVDTRVLAMTASPPDQLIDVDLANPQSDTELLAQLTPTHVCALVADPSRDRRLRWSLTLCYMYSDGRCGLTMAKLTSGFADDPETTLDATTTQMCADVMPDGNLLGVIRASYNDDAYHGLGGIAYGVSLVVGGEDVDPSLDLFAIKTLQVAPRIPAERTANTNPDVDRIDVAIDDAEPVPLPLGRCVEQASPLTVRAGATVRFTPIETATTRETYVVPTLDGQQESFTEAPTYQWIASAGGFSQGMTGGPRDFVGNPAPLFTDWRAPKKELGDVALWIIQRDERLGVTWYESCLRVTP